VTVTDARPAVAPGGRRRARLAAALDAERARQARQPKLSPLEPADPHFLAWWTAETELQVARDADAADWTQAAKAATYGLGAARHDYRRDDRPDHPGGPVPVWGPTARSPRTRGGRALNQRRPASLAQKNQLRELLATSPDPELVSRLRGQLNSLREAGAPILASEVSAAADLLRDAAKRATPPLADPVW
jgi:hypothetical protein